MNPTCARCHVEVRATDYFCYNCGVNLHPEKLLTTPDAQIALYLKSILLPPMGIIWGMRYLRQDDRKSKMVGWAAIGITVFELWFLVVSTTRVINTVNATLNSQLNGLGGF